MDIRISKYHNILCLFATIFFVQIKSNGQNFQLIDNKFNVNDSLSKIIYFTFDKVTIMNESLPFMDSLSQFLITNKKLKIEIANNTGLRGAAEYNLKLSQFRAQIIADYLIDKGVESSRLTAIGYGSYHPLITADKISAIKDDLEREKSHMLNMRTVFRIVAID